ncbi:hypothetical protein SERLADRAFT_404821 [Serpula lacrymans var. lacrymans S7.9]|uniref:Uncharacterized protein n=1 Tax=Serpula lacrymans var. lacrymans (strain S7.9) TaxID=578457 RepID=F8NFA1_SERL9|nr:uncharacterized protein SERLADRAFT_404821 [Serpula lacrymans var. lacrymans S7.9]EGO30815.1 hypothetical protein SERLADRAFT_404821 [Serpula lacrymans var. lacrymans S7.9]
MPVILLELIIPLISQLVEQLACIQKVPGSIPGLVIIQFYHMYDDKMRTNTAIKAGTKQRILALKEEIQALKSGVLKTKSINSWVNQGCGIWCLVSLLDSISDMVAEHNWQIYEQGDEEDLVQPQDYSEKGFKELVYYISALKKKLNEDFAIMKGLNGAQGDNTGNIKPAAVQWLSELFLALSTTPLDPLDEAFCTISQVALFALICDHHPKYLVTAKLWPTFMYVDYKYNPEDNEKGLFQSTLLLRAYKFVFTSPSSAFSVQMPQMQISQKSIAYIAVQLCFALSSVGSWRVEGGDFNYQQFYNNIPNFFKMPPGPTSKAKI